MSLDHQLAADLLIMGCKLPVATADGGVPEEGAAPVRASELSCTYMHVRTTRRPCKGAATHACMHLRQGGGHDALQQHLIHTVCVRAGACVCVCVCLCA